MTSPLKYIDRLSLAAKVWLVIAPISAGKDPASQVVAHRVRSYKKAVSREPWPLKFPPSPPIQNLKGGCAPGPDDEANMSDNTRSEALQSQYLTVALGHEEYGIDILAVREIRGWTPVTRIPQAPHYVLGVLNLRGAIVPVIDMRLRFGLPREEYGATTVTVIVTVAGRNFGVVVDAVSDVLDVSADAIRPVPDMGTTVDTEYLKGLTAAGERMVLLLDVDKLLQPQDAQMLEAALPAVSDVKAVA